jgi:hypothetical protein
VGTVFENAGVVYADLLVEQLTEIHFVCPDR